MPKENIDDWCARIARQGGGRAAAYYEAFEGDEDDDEEYDADEEERLYEQQQAARKKRLLKETAEARQALAERAAVVQQQELERKQDWMKKLRAFVDEHIYGPNYKIKVILGKKEETPLADEYYHCTAAGMTKLSYELAMQELEQERKRIAPVHAKALEEERRRPLKELLAGEIKAVLEARSDLEALGRDLGLALGWPDLADPMPRTLSDGEIATERQAVAAERAELQARATLLGTRTWGPGQLTEMAPDVKAAHDNLVAALKARGPLPGPATDWIRVLNAHAYRRAADLRYDDYLENLPTFIAANPKAWHYRKTCEQFAEEYDYDAKDWELIQKAWKSLVAKPPPGAAARNGILPLETMNSRFRGTTAGQRYTDDREFSFGGHDYVYHLSISFKAPPGEPSNVQITKLHVSFKRKGAEPRYWYNVANGTVTFGNVAGGAVENNDMHTRANRLVKGQAARFRCNF